MDRHIEKEVGNSLKETRENISKWQKKMEIFLTHNDCVKCLTRGDERDSSRGPPNKPPVLDVGISQCLQYTRRILLSKFPSRGLTISTALHQTTPRMAHENSFTTVVHTCGTCELQVEYVCKMVTLLCTNIPGVPYGGYKRLPYSRDVYVLLYTCGLQYRTFLIMRISTQT